MSASSRSRSSLRRVAPLAGSLVALALVVAGCSGGVASPSPSASASGDTPSPSAASSSPSGGLASGSPSPTGDLAAFACPIETTMLIPPSNRLTGIVVTPRAAYDEVAFTFGPSGTGSGATPGLIVAPATPPFTHGGSGAALTIDGQRFVELTFRDMIVADEGGVPTYSGAADLRPGSAAVREVAQAEAFEGVVRWIVGMAEPGCARVRVDGAGGRIVLDVRLP